ncbi:hypothetical protein Ancab_025258 [Ancistrocladus abbreviatus]
MEMPKGCKKPKTPSYAKVVGRHVHGVDATKSVNQIFNSLMVKLGEESSSPSVVKSSVPLIDEVGFGLAGAGNATGGLLSPSVKNVNVEAIHPLNPSSSRGDD